MFETVVFPLLDQVRRLEVDVAELRGHPVPPDTWTDEEARYRHLIRVLEKCNGNKMRTARVLGINIKTVYAVLQRWEDKRHGRS